MKLFENKKCIVSAAGYHESRKCYYVTLKFYEGNGFSSYNFKADWCKPFIVKKLKLKDFLKGEEDGD